MSTRVNMGKPLGKMEKPPEGLMASRACAPLCPRQPVGIDDIDPGTK